MPDFVLDARLQQDCLPITDFPLCRLLMMNDARFPWFLLVPRVPGAHDAIDLDADDYRRLWDESGELSRAMRTAFTPHKLNVAALGNQARGPGKQLQQSCLAGHQVGGSGLAQTDAAPAELLVGKAGLDRPWLA